MTSLTDGRGSVLLIINKAIYRIEKLQMLLSPSADRDLEHLSGAVHSAINKGTAYLLSLLGRSAAAFIGKAPQIIGASVFFTVCAVWLSIDLDGIRRETRRILPKKVCDRLFSAVEKIRIVSVEFVLSHTVLFALTLAETYIGLCVLRVRFPLALSFLVAAVDILPLLGAGAVLLPVAAIAAISGNAGIGLGILALLGVLCVTRQIAEPCVLGKSIGVHPFLSFLSAFAGLALFGASGAIILPLLVSLTVGTKRK